MKNKIKVVLEYIIQFFLAMFFSGLILLISISYFINKPNYLLKQLEKNQYSKKIGTAITEELDNYVIQSGLSSETIQNLFTEQEIQNNVEQTIKSFYQNKDLQIETDTFKTNLKNNIDNYLKENNVTAQDENALNQFVEQMTKIYEGEFTLSNMLPKVQGKWSKLQTYLNVGIIVFLVMTIMIYIVQIILCKKYSFAIPFYTCGLIIFTIYFFIKNHIDMHNIRFFSDSVSETIQKIGLDLHNKLMIMGIAFLIIGILSSIISGIISSKKRENEV